MPLNIYRLGQVSGDRNNGVWNTNEMAPMMIYAAAGRIHRMPNLGQDINWIPVDISTASIVHLALKSPIDTCRSINECIHHLLNPTVLKYEDYLNCLRQAGLHFEIVSPQEFIKIILTTTDMTNPLVKLSSFLEKTFTDKESSNLINYDLTKTIQRCHLLRNCPPIDSNLIKLYLNYWKECQLLK